MTEQHIMDTSEVKDAVAETLVDHAGDFNLAGIADAIQAGYAPIASLDDIPTDDYWEIVRAHDASPVEETPATVTGFDWPRFRELNKMRKAELCALYRKLGHVWSPHPLEKWRKEEIITSILEVEKRNRGEVDPPTPEDYTSASISGVDVSKPYGYRVSGFYDRGEGVEEVALSTGYRDQAEDGITGSLDVARVQVDQTRTGHSFYGPTRVYVWEKREQEHYRMPLPDENHHDRYDFAAVPKPAETTV